LALELEAGEQGAGSKGDSKYGSPSVAPVSRFVTRVTGGEVGDVITCSALLHGRRKGSFPPAPCPLPPASSLRLSLKFS